MVKIIFTRKELLSCNPNFNKPVIRACKNQDNWNVKFDIPMYIYIQML